MPSTPPQKAAPKVYAPVKRPDPISADSKHDHELCLAKLKSYGQSLDESERKLEGLVKEYNERAEEHRAEVTELTKRTERQARDVEAKTEEIEEVQKRLSEVEADYEEVSSKLAAAEEDIAEGSHAYEDQEKLLDVLRKDIDELEEQKEEVEGKLSLAEARVVEKTGAIAKLEEEIAKLSKKLSEDEVEMHKFKRVQDNNQVAQDAVEIDNRKLKEELAAVKGKNKDLAAQVQQAKEALEKQGGCACVVM